MNKKNCVLATISIICLVLSLFSIQLWSRHKTIEKSMEGYILARIESIKNSVKSIQNGGETSRVEQDCAVIDYELDWYNMFNRKVSTDYLDRLIFTYQKKLDIVRYKGIDEQTMNELHLVEKYLNMFLDTVGEDFSKKIGEFNELLSNDEKFYELVR